VGKEVRTVDLRFKLERETKNTYRFFELNEEGQKADYEEYMIGTLYVQKAFFNGSKPEEIVVSISVPQPAKGRK
jgi:hypothetical protein